jgi:broad-specificity NMP kinase
MINRYFYKSSISEFISSSTDFIFGQISRADEMDTMSTQKFAWVVEIETMKRALQPWKQEAAEIIFEYSIPRLGKRIDVVVLLRERVFVIEFKVGETEFLHQDVDQVMDYALDLKNFHQGSIDRLIVPVLVATESSKYSTVCQPSHYDDGVYEPLMTDSVHLGDVINMVLLDYMQQKAFNIAIENWARSRYSPTPTIIEAARSLYLNHSVDEITRHEAEGEQLERTTRYVQQVIRETKAKRGKSICFVTGVPGAGKTLVGLNVAVQQESNEDLAVYLSGNGPLVAVLTEALTRDKQAQEKARGNRILKKDAEREVKRFIQIIHRYRDNMLGKVRVVNGHIEIDPTKELKDHIAGYGEVENIAIFDEAQRSWDKEHIAAWLNRKKGFAEFPMSEGEFLIWSLDQRKDWAVIVCLVGGGQEINTGEAGIGEWIRALNESFPDWQIYISSQLTAKEYAEGKISELLNQNRHVIYSDDLHLAVSMRSFRAESLSNMVHYLLDGESEKAKEVYESITDRYPIVLTRNLEKAKKWLRDKARGNERYGLVVSSKAYRLKPLAIDVRCKPDTVHWFLDDINDVRSSLFLEDAASEFDIQGLELDWTCLIWDGDLRYNGTTWDYFEFNGGSKWNRINKEERKAYQLNAYRVLLTRARQGMVICVPEGNSKDHTRLPEFYDGTYLYLKSLGFQEI